MKQRKTFIHPTAFIDPDVKIEIGEGTRIFQGAILGAQGVVASRDENGDFKRIDSKGGIIIGRNVDIGAGAIVQRGHHGNTVIGDGSIVDSDCHVSHDCKLGRAVHMTTGATMAGSVTIGDFVRLGIGCVLRDGITLGDRVFVGMGAIVIRDVPAGKIVVGNPAKPINRRIYKRVCRVIFDKTFRARFIKKVKKILKVKK